MQYPYIYINRNYKPYATNFSGTLPPNARDIQLRELIKQEYHLFDKDLNMKEFRENEYKLTNIPYKKWVPGQRIQLQNIMFTDPPSFLGAINPFPWVKSFSDSRTPVHSYYGIDVPLFNDQDTKFKREAADFTWADA